MRLVVSDAAADFVRERGGRLYVSVDKARCCGGEESERFELFLPARLSPLPDELHIDVARFPRRVEAYWNGCAWVV
jgi:hypothetical protein